MTAPQSHLGDSARALAERWARRQATSQAHAAVNNLVGREADMVPRGDVIRALEEALLTTTVVPGDVMEQPPTYEQLCRDIGHNVMALIAAVAIWERDEGDDAAVISSAEVVANWKVNTPANAILRDLIAWCEFDLTPDWQAAHDRLFQVTESTENIAKLATFLRVP